VKILCHNFAYFSQVVAMYSFPNAVFREIFVENINATHFSGRSNRKADVKSRAFRLLHFCLDGVVRLFSVWPFAQTPANFANPERVGRIPQSPMRGSADRFSSKTFLTAEATRVFLITPLKSG
jgi:hypothetical protein